MRQLHRVAVHQIFSLNARKMVGQNDLKMAEKIYIPVERSGNISKLHLIVQPAPAILAGLGGVLCV